MNINSSMLDITIFLTKLVQRLNEEYLNAYLLDEHCQIWCDRGSSDYNFFKVLLTYRCTTDPKDNCPSTVRELTFDKDGIKVVSGGNVKSDDKFDKILSELLEK